MKKRKAKVFAVIMTVMMLMGSINFSYATSDATSGDTNTNVQNEQNVDTTKENQSNNSSKSQDDNKASTVDKKTDNSSDAKNSESTKTKLMDVGETKSDSDMKELSTVVDTDKTFITLKDKDGKIISTSDTSQTQADKYKNGGTVALGQAVQVDIELGSIKEHKGNEGIQEGVKYCMNLPTELVTSKDSKYLNKDVEFATGDGNLVATGGIYKLSDGTEQLRITFTNVEGHENISGDFVYWANISEDLDNGKKYDINIPPCGEVSFTVESSYSLDVKGGFDSDYSQEASISNTMYWDVNYASKMKEYKKPDSNMHLSLDGSALDVTKDSQDDVKATVTYKSGKSETLTIKHDKAFANSYYNADGKKLFTIDYSDESTKCVASNDNEKLVTDFDLIFGENDTNLKSIELKFKSEITNNNNEDSYKYKLDVSLTVDKANEKKLDASKTCGRDYKSVNMSIKDEAVNTESDNSQKGSLSYSGLPGAIKTTITADSSKSGSDYYEFTFEPSVENSLNAYYQFCAKAFNKTAELGDDVSFSNFNVAGNEDWTYIGKSKSSAITTADDSLLDQYRYESVLGSSDEYVLWRSSQKVNGKYIYVAITTEQADRVAKNSKTNEGGYVESYKNSKPLSWKMYVFNTSGSESTIEFYQRLSALNSGDVTGGAITDELKYKSSTKADNSKTGDSITNITKKRMVSLKGYEMSNDLIRWEVTINAKNLAKDGKQLLQYATGYANFSDGQTPVGNTATYFKLNKKNAFATDFSSTVTEDGKGLYVYNPSSGEWKQINSSIGENKDETAKNLSDYVDSSYSRPVSDMQYAWSKFEGASLIDNVDSDGNIRISYFTKKTTRDASTDTLKSTFELNMQTSEINAVNYANNNSGNRYAIRAITKEVGVNEETKSDVKYTLTKKVTNAPADKTIDGKSDGKVRNNWQVNAAVDNVTDASDFINSYTLTDNMSNVTATVDGKKISNDVVDPAKYIKLVNMNVNASYKASAKENAKTPSEITYDSNDINDNSLTSGVGLAKNATYKLNRIDDYGIIGGTVNWHSVLNYEGSMADGFELNLENMRGVSAVSIGYTTEFDEAAYLKALSAKGEDVSVNSSVTLKQSNSAVGDIDGQKKNSSTTIEDTFAASLALNKSVSAKDGNNSYTLKSEVGANPVSYFKLSDYLYSFKEVQYSSTYGTTYADEVKDEKALELLAKCFTVKNMKITVKEPNSDTATTVYQNNEATQGWNVKFNNPTGAELFNLQITKNGSNICADSVVTVTYDTDFKMSDEFNNSEYRKYRDKIFVYNNAKAIVPYGDNNISYVTTKGESGVDKDNHELWCIAGSGIGSAIRPGGDYGTDTNVKKTYDSKTGAYKISVQRGDTDTRDGSTAKLVDKMIIRANDYYLELRGNDKSKLDSSQRKKYLEIVGKIIRDNTHYYNLKVYKGSSQEPIATKDGKVIGDEQLADGVSLKLSTSESGYDYINMLSLTVDNLDNLETVYATYQVKTDWNQAYEDINKAIEENELPYKFNSDDDLYLSLILMNNLSSYGEDAKYTFYNYESIVDVGNAGLTKDYQNLNTKTSSVDWTVTATTASDDGILKIKDSMYIGGWGLKTTTEQGYAVMDATEIKNIKIIKGSEDGEVIYDQNKDNGEDSNIEISQCHSGVSYRDLFLSVKIKNAEANTKYILKYTTELNKVKLVELLGSGNLDNLKYMYYNECSMYSGHYYDGTTKTTGWVTPEFKSLDATKKSVDSDETGTTKWNISASTGDYSYENFTIKDTVTSDNEDRDKDNLAVSDMTVKVGNASYKVSEGLPPGAHLYKADGKTNFKLGEYGSADFVLVFDKLPKGTTVNVDYTIVVDGDSADYSRDEKEYTINLKNTAIVSTSDGSNKTVSDSESTYLPKVLSKKNTKVSKDENGNSLLTWTMYVDLSSKFTDKEIKDAKDVTVTDQLSLSHVLEYVDGSAKVNGIKAKSDGSGYEIDNSKELSSDQYEVTTNEDGDVLVKVKDPAVNNKFAVTITTKAIRSVAKVYNNAKLKLGAKEVTTTSDDKPDTTSIDESGTISSEITPTYTPRAEKYINHKRMSNDSDDDQKFEFKAVEVTKNADGSYSEVKDGYSSTAYNDRYGDITFDKITYTDKDTREGDHYYKVTETKLVKDKDDAEYNMDSTEYILKVNITKSVVNKYATYQVEDEIVTPEKSDGIAFDNTKKEVHDFEVTKKWEGDDSAVASAKRPDSITVYLTKDGKRYKDKSAVLNKDNNWTYVFKNLPDDGQDGNTYSVEEVKVNHYDSSVVSAGWKAVVTNKYVKLPDSYKVDYTPTATKKVNGEKIDKDEVFQFSAIEVTPSEDGNYTEVKDGYSSTVQNDTDGKVTFDTATYAGEDQINATHYYKIKETKVVKGKDSVKYTMDDTEYIVKVTCEEQANGEYVAKESIVSPTDKSAITFNNKSEKLHTYEVTKKWENEGNVTTKRPDKIIVRLYKDDKPYKDMSATLTKDNNWTYVFKDLPDDNQDGNSYSVKEDPVANYDSSVVSAGWKSVVTNTYVRQPDSYKVDYTPTANKTVNGEKIDKNEVFEFSATEVTPSDDGSYTEVKDGYKSTALNDEDGNVTFDTDTYAGEDDVASTHYYKIKEIKVIKGKENVKYTMDDTEYIIKVTCEEQANGEYVATETILSPKDKDKVVFDNKSEKVHDYEVTKKWDDNNDAAGVRPDKITVRLYRDNEPYKNMTATLSKDNNWTYVFKDLPDDGEEGNTYSVKEDAVEHYNTSLVCAGWKAIITNKYIPDNPSTPTEPTPPDKTSKTGDNTPIGMLFGLMAIAAAGGGFAAFGKRRKEQK